MPPTPQNRWPLLDEATGCQVWVKHGFAALCEGITATVVAPHGNSVEKNAAMRALGVELIEAGADFDEARGVAAQLAEERGLDRAERYRMRPRS